MFPAFFGEFFHASLQYLFLEVLLETRSWALDRNDSRMDLDTSLLWSTAKQCKL